MIRWIARSWDRFFFRPFDPIPLALCRIFLGLLITVSFLAQYPNWERFYATDGIVSWQQLDLDAEEIRTFQNPWSVFLWTEAFVPLWVWWWVGLAASVAFTVGWRTWWATILLFALFCTMINHNRMVVHTHEQVCRMMLFYSCFAPLGGCLSVDNWFRGRRLSRAGRTVPRPTYMIWPLRLMQLNFLWIYAYSLPVKLASDVAWWNGEAVFWALTSHQWGRDWLPIWPFYVGGALLSRLATWGTVLVEASLPLLVWHRKTVLWVLAAGVLMHTSMAILMANVAFFTLSMVCCYWLFVPPELIREWLRLPPWQAASPAER